MTEENVSQADREENAAPQEPAAEAAPVAETAPAEAGRKETPAAGAAETAPEAAAEAAPEAAAETAPEAAAAAVPEAAAEAAPKAAAEAAPKAAGEASPEAAGEAAPKAAGEAAPKADGEAAPKAAAGQPAGEQQAAVEPRGRPGRHAPGRGGRVASSGVAHVKSTFNNTMVSITDSSGGVVAWSSGGRAGFKGSRKSTAFAATIVGQEAARQAMSKGVREVEVRVQGAGAGRESAVRALQAAGMNIMVIRDVTPVPHNGCRPRKRRRV